MSRLQTIIPCDDIDESIEHYARLGYRLDMIFPADSPREALVSKDGERVRLSEPSALAGGNELAFPVDLPIQGRVLRAHADGSDFVRGRAGMEYRDLIPGRLGGKVIASQIRLPVGGEVPDSVHYHSVDFQMIYCVRGRIQVVYDDQGPPFWLERGDCILQPPRIRHRVLFSEAGAEVIEVSSPAEHETWIEHNLQLPSADGSATRNFSGSRFVRHIAADDDPHERDTGIAAATGGRFDVRIRRVDGRDVALLLELRGLSSKGDGALSAPISIEISV